MTTRPRRSITTPEAESDIAAAAQWYESQSAGLGDRFVTAVRIAIRHAFEHPRQFPRVRRTPEVRRVITKGFPYRVFYIRRADALVIFRVLHGARHDREWKSAVPK